MSGARPSPCRTTTPGKVADFGCFLGCPASAYAHLRDLLDDPASDDRPFQQLAVESWRHAADRLVESLTPAGRALHDELGLIDDDARACEPLGLVRQMLVPLPIEFRQEGDRVVIRYEEWAVVRTVPTDGRGPPADPQPSRYGHSVGHYDGGTLVIETVGIEADRFWLDHGGGGHTGQLRTLERYTRDGDVLRLELTLEDPIVLREPLVYEKVWRHTPDVELLEHGCETVTGDLER